MEEHRFLVDLQDSRKVKGTMLIPSYTKHKVILMQVKEEVPSDMGKNTISQNNMKGLQVWEDIRSLRCGTNINDINIFFSAVIE